MASSGPCEFGLGHKLSYVPKSLPNVVKDLSDSESNEVKLLLLNDYILKCQEEMIFAGVFKQELPQCRLLLMDRDVLATKKRGCEEQQRLDLNNLCSDQWSNIPTHHHHNKRQKCGGSLSIDPSPSMVVNPLTQCICRINRRSWTPELRARFVVALHLLGGPEVATPKQIRDHMQVKGLTTDQVKSHLQYRMNWRSSPENATDPLRKSKLFCSDLPRPPSAAAGGINMEEIN
ncbi:hypothetical protein P3X46_016304 [Hevea brasiliensis]|uniref:HTH myb-type domain-containing protein n=1 Tax=Hevea brasiliensis TaxID=3981 RepID=A0ABQ9M2Q3_HEVBR|nr:hypothetical protein P3X46_016304 [Hevea brasiliensis]